MKLVIYIALLVGCAHAKVYLPYYQVEGVYLYYKINVNELSHGCSYNSDQDNCLCSLQVRSSSPSLEWHFRRAKDNEWCRDFDNRMKKILSSKNEVKILGYDSPSKSGKISELQYFGAIKGAHDCIEWFVGDCKRIK